MRNLKRALSLTLASVMLLGMMVVGAGAASYPDVDESNNIEAIEVMQAVKVMEGDSAGNFDPDRPVSRAEMAVIMALLLDLDYDYYRGTKTFDDVPNWCAPYVAACYANGIVSGYNATTYGSADTVNAVQAASMMMRALGYFKYSEDYEGDFILSTVKQASKIELFKNINANSTDPLTRNQVAQLALNTLRSNIVDFAGDPGFEVNGVKVGYRPQYDPRTGTESKYNAIAGLTTTLGKDESRYYVQLGEQLYNGDLRLVDTAADDYDRPARHWEYNGKAIGTYAKNELLREEYTTGISGKDLYSLLSAATIKEYDVTYYVDGAVNDTIKDSNMIRTNDRTYETTGKGVLTQVYVDNTNKEITIVSINTFLAKATADYNDKKGTLSVEVYAPKTTTKTIEVEEVPGIEEYKSGDYILVNWAEIGSTGNKMEIVDVAAPETQSDVKISKYSEESYVVTGGTQYDYAKRGIYKNELGAYTSGSLKDHSYILYFDKYGYLAGVREFEGTKNYLFLAAYDGTGSHMGIKTFPGAAVFLDGTMEEIQINVTDTNKNLTWKNNVGTVAEIDHDNYPKLEDGDNQYNRWFTYTTTTKNGNTVYTLKPVITYTLNDGKTAIETITNFWAEQEADATKELKINSGSVRVDADVASKVGAGDPKNKRAYGNDDSVYLTMEINEVSKDEAHSGDDLGLTKVTGTYTGVQDVDLKVYNKTDNTLAGDSGIIAVFDEDLYIIGAVVVGEDNSSSDSYIYILDKAKNERYDAEADCTFWEMDAVVDGVITTVTVKDKYGNMKDEVNDITGVDNPGKDCLVKVTYDKDGYITDIPVIEPNDVATDDRYSAADYTNDIEDGYGANASDFKTYSVKYAAGTTGDKPKTGDFYRTGRTLFNDTKTTSGKYDAGITLGKDGKVIVVQNDRTVKGQKDKRVWDEFSDLQSAIDWLANSKTFTGYVSAVLNDNGSAKYIVFNGTDRLDTVDDNGSDKIDALVWLNDDGSVNITATESPTPEAIADLVRSTRKESNIASVKYDAKAGAATIEYTDGRKDVTVPVTLNKVTEKLLAAAAWMQNIQAKIDEKNGTYAMISFRGNTMTAYSSDGYAYLSNGADSHAVGTASQATSDFVGFLVALYEDGATQITYGSKDYTWDDTKTTASKWVNGGNTLANDVVTAMGTALDVTNMDGTTGTQTARILLKVTDKDGVVHNMNFVITVEDTGAPDITP